MIDHFFSPSELAQFDFCLERGASTYYGEVEDKGNDSALFGSAVHVGIEAFLLNKKAGFEPIHLTDMVEIFGIELRDRIARDGVNWNKFKGPDELIALAAQAYGSWLAEVEEDVHPNLVEWRFGREKENRKTPDAPPVLAHEDDERRIWLSGEIDCVDFANVIWDWKTATRPYQPWEKQRWAVPPSVYAFGLHELTLAQWPITFRYAILLHDGSVQQLVVTRTEEHVDWLRHKLLALAKVLESGQRPLPLNDTGWWCSPDWCANWDRCKGSHHGGDDWKKVHKIG